MLLFALAPGCRDRAKEADDRPPRMGRPPPADALPSAPAFSASPGRPPAESTQRAHEMGSLVHDWDAAIDAHQADGNLERVKASRCEDAVMALVYATAEAKQVTHDIEEGAKRAPVDDPVSVGGMVYPPDLAGSPTWTVAICENHPERMPCFDYFEVDTNTGVVTYSRADSDGGALRTDPKGVARVREACK